MEINKTDNYINLEEAANYLGIRPVTLRSWIKNPKNEIPAHKIGRLWKFKRSEIDEWVQSGKSAIEDFVMLTRWRMFSLFRKMPDGAPDLDKRELGDVVDIFTNNIDMSNTTESEDLLGCTYEYCIAQFAQKEGVGGGELDSTCGLSDEELTVRFRESIRIDNEVRKIKGLPVAGYDDETQKAYLEYPDGRREYVRK